MTDHEEEPRKRKRKRGRPTAIMVLAVLACLYTLYFAREFLLPVTFALLLDFLLRPAVRLLVKVRIHQAIAAGIVVLGLIGVTGLAVYELSGPVQAWVVRAPESIEIAKREFGKLLQPLERMQQTAKQVESATGQAATQTVIIQGPSILSRVFGPTSRVMAAAFETLILLYFLLAAGDLFLRKLIKVLPLLRDKLKAVRIARQVEDSISTYLTTAAAVNFIEGIAVAGATWLIGIPNPLLWGALVLVLEFIPYLGAMIVMAILTVAGLTTFGTLGNALLAPGAFLLINLVQANLITPMLLSHRLSLNPVAVFIGLAFWFWIWGIPGAFIGVPVLAVLKICCDQIEGLGAIGDFLGGKDEAELLA